MKKKSWLNYMDKIVNEANTPEGKVFDIVIITSIILSTILIVIESVDSIRFVYGDCIVGLQHFFMMLFSLEYILRVLLVDKKRKYITSFFGIIDLLAILPAYLSFFMPYSRIFPVIRTLRLLRLFSIFKMGRYINASSTLLKSIRASRQKITVFIVTLFLIIIVVGSMMYVVEGPENGFANIPESMYWAVVTVSTVGYGDISPQTPIGKIFSSLLMILGYGIIAVPTGIITNEISKSSRQNKEKSIGILCQKCGNRNHFSDAVYCHQCGYLLE